LKKNLPLVSVIIPTYKRPSSLKNTIVSVLNQTYENIEIIVVDDNDPEWNSREETEKIMNDFKGNNTIKYVKHNKNMNGSAARNTGIRNSAGDFLMFLDDDDEFFSKKVEAQINRMIELDDSWGASYTSYVRKRNGKTIVYGAETREGSLLKEELMRNLFIHAGSNLMVRRSVVLELDGFDESFERNQDVEFLTRLLVNYKIAYVNELGLIVNVHKNNVATNNFEIITETYLKKFKDYIAMLSPHDQDKIEKMINLQVFRNHISTRNFKKAGEKIRNRKVSFLIVLKYYAHLVRRKLKKQAYGFKI
jgi:glycosyltransferase involved in cell wall biosynthesis